MWRFLEAVRTKSEQERKRIAFMVASSITLVIFFTWLITVPFSTQEKSTNQVARPTGLAPSLSDTFTELESTFNVFFQEFQAVQEELGSFDDAVNDSVNVGSATTTDEQEGGSATSTINHNDEAPSIREESENMLE